MQRINLIFLMLSIIASTSYSQESYHLRPLDEFVFDGTPAPITDMFGLNYKDNERSHFSSAHVAEYAIWSAMLEEGRAEDLILQQERLVMKPEKLSYLSLLLGYNYFSQESYASAQNQLQKVDVNFLSEDLLEEYYFKNGYLSLVSKNFDESLSFFDKSLSQKSNEYKIHSNYYLGINHYFLGDQDKAVSYFEKTQNVKNYLAYIPYYLTQIYFTKGEYEKVIEFGTNSLQLPDLENAPEIEKLIAQSYYKKGSFEKALVHFKKYESNSPKLAKEEFYQIGETYYKLRRYEEASKMFLAIKNVGGDMEQIANYYLADCYLNLGNKPSALAAFKNASTAGSNQAIKDNSIFNYAKLAYETDNDRLAITTLADLPESNPNFNESQRLLSQILMKSNDYLTAMKTIEGLQRKSPELLRVYQTMSYNTGITKYQDTKYQEAAQYFKQAIETPGTESNSIQSKFWLADILERQGKESESRSWLKEIVNSQTAKNNKVYFLSHYKLAYQYYNADKLDLAITHFKETEKNYIGSHGYQQVFNDAILRIADCQYVRRDFVEAKNYYEKANRNQSKNKDYTIFQLANIEALQGRQYDAIVMMEDLVESYPNSQYRDNALYFSGLNYQTLGKHTAALDAYLQIADGNNTSSNYYVPALLKAALISYNAGDMKAALIKYRKVFAHKSSAEEKKQALTAIEEIYVYDLNDPQSYFEFAKTEAGLQVDDFAKDSLSYAVAKSHYKNNRFQQAIIAYDKYLKAFSQGYYAQEARYYQAESNIFLKDFSEALESFEMVIEDQNSPFYQESLEKASLIAFNHEHDHQKSADYAQRALQNPSDEKLKKDLMEIATVSLYKTKNFSSLLEVSNLYLSENDLEDFEIAKINFYKAKALNELNESDEAIKSYNKVVQYSNNVLAAEASYEMAQIFRSKGMNEQAENQALETTKRAANYPSWVAKSLIMLSDIYLEKGDQLNAKAAIEAVLENYKEDPEINAQAKLQSEKILEYESKNNRVKESQKNDQIELDSTKK